MRSALSATLLMATLLWTTDAVAAPITCRFSGVVDGNLNGLSFANADFLFELTADTANCSTNRSNSSRPKCSSSRN